MDETEIKNILLEFVEPNRNQPNSDDIIPWDVKGWRFPHTRDHGEYNQPVCFWTGITCDPIDGSVTGLNLGNGFYVHSLLGQPGGDEEHDNEHGDSSQGGIQRHNNRMMLIEEGQQDWLNYDINFDGSILPKSRQLHSHRRIQNATTNDDFSNNNATYAISPTFPPSLGKLTSLRFINLSHNHLQGSIPQNVLSLPNLEILDVQGNDLEGTFPHFVSDALRVLDLSKNRFHGHLDEDLFGHPKIGKNTAPYLISLVKFDVSHNGLNGTIPLDGTSGYYNPEVEHEESLQNLQYFDLGYNLCK